MHPGLRRLCAIGGASAVALLAGSGAAQAAFPDFSNCPRSNPLTAACIDITATGGSMTIKGFEVPLNAGAFAIRGGVNYETNSFIPPANGTGFTARPVQVPGGLLGINFPIPGNAVTATAQLAGPPSAIRLNIGELGVALPLKLKLSNPIIGPGCQIGSDRNPAQLNMITGTTNPPAPNRPISGARGRLVPSPGFFGFYGNTNVDNSFSVPSATNCGINLGLINALVNAKLGLPSASGNNEMIVTNDAALGANVTP